MSGPKTASYVVDQEAIRRRQEEARLRDERTRLAYREARLRRQIAREREQHADRIAVPGRLAALVVTGSLEQQQRQVRRRRHELDAIEQTLEEQAREARRDALVRGLASVAASAPAEVAADGAME